MIYSEETMQLLDLTNQLVKSLKQTEVYQSYAQAIQQLDNLETKVKIDQFKQAKEDFALIEEYGKYAPDYKEKRQKLRQAKKELDLNEFVSNYRQKELILQKELDEISVYLASSISNDIQINYGNPFKRSKNCGGC